MTLSSQKRGCRIFDFLIMMQQLLCRQCYRETIILSDIVNTPVEPL